MARGDSRPGLLRAHKGDDRKQHLIAGLGRLALGPVIPVRHADDLVQLPGCQRPILEQGVGLWSLRREGEIPSKKVLTIPPAKLIVVSPKRSGEEATETLNRSGGDGVFLASGLAH